MCVGLIWSVCSPRREFVPSLDDFFSEAIEQADPANMVEDEYKYVCTLGAGLCVCDLSVTLLSNKTGSCGTQTMAGVL